jgi:CubicO group peptidase (beta-lactamase class C family)
LSSDWSEPDAGRHYNGAMRKVLLLALAVSAAFAAGFDAERLARIPVRMKAFVEKGTVSGMVTLLARHGKVEHHEAVGLQDIEAKKAMRGDTIFQIMSMTKPVTGVAIMILAEEGRLALSDPVERHLPEFRGQWVIDTRDGDKTLTLKRPSRPITIRDLMTHTSGMGSHNPIPDAERYTLAEAVAMYSQRHLEFDPGTRWLYSNSGIETLGRIVEVLSDRPFEKFVEERIFTPLGMKDSHFAPPAEKHARVAALYQSTAGKLTRSDFNLYRKGFRGPLPAGGMYSTASDMAVFHQMMLNGGTYQGRKILSRPGVDVMTVNHTGALTAGHGPGLSFGLTWNVVREPLGTLAMLSEGTFMHGGAFGTHGWVDRKKDLVGVFMIQRAGGGGSAERDAFITMANAAVVD